MPRTRTYSDDELVEVIAASHSWRGVLRSLGLVATSGSAVKSVRRRADELAVDYRHFTGARRWTDLQLLRAVETSRTWAEVVERLGLAHGSARFLHSHAVRLGADVAHLGQHTEQSNPIDLARPSRPLAPDSRFLRVAGPSLAAAWFSLCGMRVSWPLEPARYDLVTDMGDRFVRIQVKTTTQRYGRDSWIVWLSTTSPRRETYSPDEIDSFFIIDGDMEFYLIPVTVVAGLHAITLGRFQEYRLRPFGDLGSCRHLDR